jgi:hypothetical protein
VSPKVRQKGPEYHLKFEEWARDQRRIVFHVPPRSPQQPIDRMEFDPNIALFEAADAFEKGMTEDVCVNHVMK